MTSGEATVIEASHIQLSVVATSRNDNHGGSLTHRMQHFVDGFVAQCKRHGLRAELILVEWNPPKERTPLTDELHWPSDTGPCDIRIITVPREMHQKLDHSAKIPLFQMIAKNAGIRRARGRFVLATNIDILFSDGVMRFMRDRLEAGTLYRTARVDIPANVPNSADFAEVLRFCDAQAFRIHGPGVTAVRRSANWTRFELLKASMDARLAYAIRLLRLVPKAIGLLFRPRELAASLARFALGVGRDYALPQFTRSKPTLSLVWYVAAGVWRRAIRITPSVLRNLILPSPFTNACGDFTLLSRADWFRLRGYVEWRTFSWHLDSLLVHQALAAGVREKRLSPSERIFHIEHGKGYTPEAAAELFSRLSQQGVPFLTDADLERLRREMAAKSRTGTEAQFNDSSWGFGDIALPEAGPTLRAEPVVPHVAVRTRGFVQT